MREVYFLVAVVCLFLSFFFSIRRRHTIFSRDWSSDVCSSDLPTGRPSSPETDHGRTARWRAEFGGSLRGCDHLVWKRGTGWAGSVPITPPSSRRSSPLDRSGPS